MSTLDQIRESIEAQIAELRSEINALRAARAALQGESAGVTRSNGNAVAAEVPAASKPRQRARRQPAAGGRPVEVLLAGKLEAMLRESEDGLSANTIAKRSNAGYAQVLALLRELERSGEVRRSGTRRTSMWHLITDEERIAERAAELEALSAAKTSMPTPTSTVGQTSDGVAVGSLGSRSRASSDSQ